MISHLLGLYWLLSIPVTYWFGKKLDIGLHRIKCQRWTREDRALNLAFAITVGVVAAPICIIIYCCSKIDWEKEVKW